MRALKLYSSFGYTSCIVIFEQMMGYSGIFKYALERIQRRVHMYRTGTYPSIGKKKVLS